MPDKLFRYILLAAVLLITGQACNEEDPGDNASFLRLKLTDATSLVIKELYVDIREISVFLVDTASREGEWYPLDFSGKAYDILKLVNGRMVHLVDQYVPAGTELQQIKLLLGNDNRFITNTDKTHPLQIPPELLEGIVIDAVKMEMRANTISNMVIDLNAALSVRESDGNYFLYPVARAFPELYGGKIRGSVAPMTANPHVAIIQERDTFYTYPERENPSEIAGVFQFIGLKEGEWEVYLLPDPESEYRDTVFVATVEEGKTTEITPRPIRLKPLTED